MKYGIQFIEKIKKTSKSLVFLGEGTTINPIRS